MGKSGAKVPLDPAEARVRAVRARLARGWAVGYALLLGFALVGAGLALVAFRERQRADAPIAWQPLGAALQERLAKHDRRLRAEAETLATQVLPTLWKGTAEQWGRDGKLFAADFEAQGREFGQHLEADLPPFFAEHFAKAVTTAAKEIAAGPTGTIAPDEAARLGKSLAISARQKAQRGAADRLRQIFRSADEEWAKAVPIGPPVGEQLPTTWRFLGQLAELLLQANTQPEVAVRPALAGELGLMRPTRPPKPIAPPIAGASPSGGAPKQTGGASKKSAAVKNADAAGAPDSSARKGL